MRFYKDCEYCEREYLAERNSSKYCSDSCKTMACRARRVAEQKALHQKEQFEIQNKLLNARYDKMIADFDKRRNDFSMNKTK